MATVSAEQRDKELQARREMLEEADKLTEDEKKTFVEHLEVRDRLFRRLHKKRIVTTLKDDIGDFKVESRLMKGSERTRFLEANKKLSEAQNDPTKYGEAMDAIKALAADIIQIPDYGREYWIGDEVTDDVVLTVVLNAFNGAAQAVMDGVQSFRPK